MTLAILSEHQEFLRSRVVALRHGPAKSHLRVAIVAGGCLFTSYVRTAKENRAAAGLNRRC